METRITSLIYAIVLPLIVAGCAQESHDITEAPVRSFENQVGTRFLPVDSYSFEEPTSRSIPLPHADDANAIWGSTGRDDEGRIYLGASSPPDRDGTAYLYQYDPVSSAVELQGDTVGQLKRLGLHRRGMGQNKLHSKFYHANDGYIYFSSFDEQGEDKDTNSVWGGMLWRKKPDDKNWQHLLTTPEALIAVNIGGNYVYALGYWDHVLYQFNTRSEQVKRVVVGSISGHVSRNFLVDSQGHAYVPSISQNSAGEISAYLNEYDTSLNLVTAYPMPSYTSPKMSKHHGIVGYTSMRNENIIFTTSEGGLYLLDLFARPDERLQFKGMMHPEGEAYIPSLFPLDGNNLVVGVARSPRAKRGYEWIVYELKTEFAATYKLHIDDWKIPRLFGTHTRDDSGNFYLVGRGKRGEDAGYRPVVLSVESP